MWDPNQYRLRRVNRGMPPPGSRQKIRFHDVLPFYNKLTRLSIAWSVTGVKVNPTRTNLGHAGDCNKWIIPIFQFTPPPRGSSWTINCVKWHCINWLDSLPPFISPSYHHSEWTIKNSRYKCLLAGNLTGPAQPFVYKGGNHCTWPVYCQTDGWVYMARYIHTSHQSSIKMVNRSPRTNRKLPKWLSIVHYCWFAHPNRYLVMPPYLRHDFIPPSGATIVLSFAS